MAAPADLSEGVSGAAKKNWTRLNHLHIEGVSTSEGYAYCDNCGAVENEEEAARPCRAGPVRAFQEKELHREIDRENREDERDEMTTVGDSLATAIEEGNAAIGFGLSEIAAAIRQHSQ